MVATPLRMLRTAWRRPQASRSFRVSSERRSRPASSSLLFVGSIARIVKGMTATMSNAPMSHGAPPPRNHRTTPASGRKNGERDLHDRGPLVAGCPLPCCNFSLAG